MIPGDLHLPGRHRLHNSSPGLLWSVGKQGGHHSCTFDDGDDDDGGGGDHSCTFHPALADDTSNRDHIFRLSALQIEKPNGILPRLVLRRWSQRL